MSQSKLIIAALSVLAGASAAQAAVFAPVAVTGFNYDVIAEQGVFTGTAASILTLVNATFDGGPGQPGTTFSAVGANSDYPLVGLPAGSTFFSDLNADHSFALAAANVNNAIQLSKTTAAGTLTFSTPAAYSELAFAVAGGWGGGTVAYTINYAGGTTGTGNIVVTNWSDGVVDIGGTPTPVDIYHTAGRAAAMTTWNNQPDIVNRNERWSLFEQIVAVDSTKSINSVDFGFVTTGNNTPSIFAVSGSAVPEPASMAGLSLVAGMLLRRKRA